MSGEQRTISAPFGSGSSHHQLLKPILVLTASGLGLRSGEQVLLNPKRAVRLGLILFGQCFLAHRIRISEILPWDRKSYLTQAILPRLSHEGSVRWLYWHSRTWLSSDVIVMLK